MERCSPFCQAVVSLHGGDEYENKDVTDGEKLSSQNISGGLECKKGSKMLLYTDGTRFMCGHVRCVHHFLAVVPGNGVVLTSLEHYTNAVLVNSQ